MEPLTGYPRDVLPKQEVNNSLNEDKKDESHAGRNEWNLIKQVVKDGKSTDWSEAKKEWEVDAVYEIKNPDEYETCTCGHYPIKEVIVIKNKHNGRELIVGNCCINKFFAFNSDYSRFFHALQKGKINSDIIEQGFEDKVINEWEHSFMKDVWRKRKRTEKQRNKYSEIKQRLLNYYQRKGMSV